MDGKTIMHRRDNVRLLRSGQADDARDFRVMRTISSEPAARAIVKHLGNPVARYYPGDENIISSGLGCKQFRISGSVYRYDTPNVLYYIYVDTLGFVENVYCKPAKNQR